MRESKKFQSSNKVLVVGGGMGGIRAALDLAETGRDVVLIDKAFAIGGLMTQLDRTFPTNNCDLCTLSPHLSASGRKLHIQLMTMTELSGLSGEAGQFTASLTTAPRYLDLEKCTGCGECYRQFPEFVRFTPGLDHRAPTCMRYPQGTPYAYSIIMNEQTPRQKLVEVCPAGAIRLDDAEKTRQMEIGAVILAPGADVFNPQNLGHYGYGVYPNVVTSLDYERILSASGPTRGELVRPSDGQRPRRIAWIQCVGSRGIQAGCVPYCSSACCMFALKEAIVTRERFYEDTETSLFYMDMRTSGKNYELYLQRAQKDYGVRLVRSRPHTVEAIIEGEEPTGDLRIRYLGEGDGGLQSEDFDMVVLATGFRVSPEVKELAEKIGIDLNEHGFARTGSFEPVATSRPGIYVCGIFESPKDIPDTMVQASAAAANAAMDLTPLRVVAESQEELPPERSVAGEKPRIGVFVCDCGLNIGGVVDVDEIVANAALMPQVVLAERIGHGCSLESLKHIQDTIGEQNLNRVVIGACSPRTHEGLFQETVRQAGLNKYLVEIANLRDQDTWVHQDLPGAAADKAKELIHMAVAAVRLARPLADQSLPMNKDVLVVGGGVAGMTAALRLADMGYKVYLVERHKELGGVAKLVRRTLAGEDVNAYIAELVKRTEGHDRIQVWKQAMVVDHSGMAGMFTTGVQVGPQMFYREIKHGITILATGALPNRTTEYLSGRHKAVTDQLRLTALLEDNPEAVQNWQKVAMIQCVGSRVAENPNCSRVCCQAAVKNALKIRELNPEAQILVLYRDMRTPGFEEDYYRKAREQGVIFAVYEPENKPVVEPDGEKVSVAFTDPIMGREVKIAADCLALSTGFVADEESTEDLGTIFHLPRTPDGYFLEDHIKLRPIDLPIQGFFVAGTAHAPKTMREAIAQAQAAAGRAQTFLARDSINLGAAVAQVDGKLCAACLICVRVCPFEVPFINEEGFSEIDPAKCHGCGVCASECPAKAIQLMQYEDDHIMAKLDGLLERVSL
jgi:heterodisulfide reductase subunit A